MSRMFTIPTPNGQKVMRTWNVFVGCRFECTYCNARRLALTRLKRLPRYQDGFQPHLVYEEMGRQFAAGDFVFISYMGDISFASLGIVQSILGQVALQPDVNFLTCTKNPSIYKSWPARLPANLYLGATIETNRDYGLSNAPVPMYRYLAMKQLFHPRTLISIEPICDFDLDILLGWMDDIGPDIIEVGADNYHNNLLEPPWDKVQKLIEGLEYICQTVIRKVGLERLERQ